MIIHEINDLSNIYVTNLLRKNLTIVNDRRIIKNYHPDYEQCSSNLFYILHNGRYRAGKGTYYVIEDNGKYVCSAGWNEYEENSNIAFALTRMFTSPEYRGKYFVANNILTKSLEATKNYSKVWMTVNEHNKALYTWFVRASQNKKGALFNDWPNIYRSFKPIGKHIIYNSIQYVVELERNNND